MYLFIRPIILFFNLKTQNQGQLYTFDYVFYIAMSMDNAKMCKTKYLVYFIAIRSSVSKVLEENSIIDPFL